MDEREEDEEEQIARIIREHDLNQLFVAFTATPAPATLTLFGEPFDTYSEAEAIAEGYIVDVATSIISYKTLYHLHMHPKKPIVSGLLSTKSQILANCILPHFSKWYQKDKEVSRITRFFIDQVNGCSLGPEELFVN
jgi:hypothetical protein